MNFHSPICQDRQPVPLRYVSEARGGDVMLQFCKRCKHGSLARCQPFLNVVLLFSVWQKRKIQVFSWQICYCWSPFVALRCPEQFLTSFKKYIDHHQVGIHTKLSQSRHARCAPRPTATVELMLMPWFSVPRISITSRNSVIADLHLGAWWCDIVEWIDQKQKEAVIKVY